jgi:hypothetical protein
MFRRCCKCFFVCCRPPSNPLTQGAGAWLATRNLQELFHETLKDIYFAEKKILSALPKMAKAAQSEELKVAFEKHENEAEEHVARLEKVFEVIDEALVAKPVMRSWGSSRKVRT